MTAEPRRIQLSRAKGWRLPENTVVVSRPGPWGNPFRITSTRSAAQAVYLFRLLLGGLLEASCREPDMRAQDAYRRHVAAHLADLRGKHLACWCRAGQACHADVLLELANRRTRP